MIHIEIQFHTNQYQACAWGNHHSEGVIDWPPAPWRILRAIVAGAYNVKLADKHQLTLKGILHKLASVLPSYTLPSVTYIQHRSPRPQVDLKTAQTGPGKTLYSAGLLMSSAQNVLHVHWSATLSEAEELVLSLCLSGVTYFGRKESVATLSLVEEAPESSAQPDPQGTRIVSIPDPELDPDTLWNALNLSAHENYGVNRSAVFPGIRQATYQIDTLKPQIQQEIWQKQNTITLAVSASPRLPFKLALKLTHRLHEVLVSRCPAPVFTGQEMGEPSKNHDHTIFQCVPDRTGRYIEQVKLYSRMGYGPEALAAIANCTNLFNVARGYVISLALADLGQKEEKFNQWISCTPFFLSRFPTVRRGKPRMLTEHYQKDSPEHQVLQYLQHLPWLNLQGHPIYQEHEEGLALIMDNAIAVIASCEPFPKFWEWESDCRQGKKVGRVGYRVTLRFSTPVTGPIILGYAAHYGLGAMAPMREWLGVKQPSAQNKVISVTATTLSTGNPRVH
ncbi:MULTISPECIES: type I-U CRISPR-associated protein Csb2 [Trichocoleus]|uniref:Type I-U CRISPR-associated protein Csb2 n=1 Tax=Trichocoleus desertorum GB2-A4 TaxID=2933944 RepID=A0ABV0JCU5_9CYAN|nr:type I-U CRISPR-associated protein Csb2 [Trichocoleus sp. FACHB-46]MBD1864246.1 type I-U CRISPR-associated protein Cas5/Cas6 [Trichocoleus sp. FACHB-46]